MMLAGFLLIDGLLCLGVALLLHRLSAPTPPRR